MKRKIILRSALGFPVGLSIGYLFTIVGSLIWANGYYSPCVPELITAMGSEINAVVLQAFLCGILGVGFTAGSVIWEIENWSIVKQTGIYFLLASVMMMPIAYFSYWMEHSVVGFLSYFGIFTLLFLIIWVIEFMIMKHNLNKINRNLYRAKRDEKGKN